MLRIAPPGTFLVRFSNSSRNSFCISGVTKDRKVRHTPFPYKVGLGIEYNNTKYKGICELIEENSSRLHLIDPVAGSKYAWLYARDEEVAPIAGYGVAD